MGRYWALIGGYNAVTTSYSECADTPGTSPFTPTENARLVGLRAIEGSAAVTTVLTAVQFKLTCSTFKPNSIECGLAAAGIHTAPRGMVATMDWVVDQEVKAGVPVVVEGRILGAYTNVTPEVWLFGLFES